jgi:hypothetical protein
LSNKKLEFLKKKEGSQSAIYIKIRGLVKPTIMVQQN